MTGESKLRHYPFPVSLPNRFRFAYTVRMLGKLGFAIYRGFFWTYERGTWQYDVMVILILVFIFATPREWFHDKPVAAPPASDVVLLLNAPPQKVYQLRATLINAQTETTLKEGAQRVLRDYTGKSLKITHIEPALDAQGQVVSYAVWVRE